jgi:membrane-associated phospholipid phosphatase
MSGTARQGSALRMAARMWWAPVVAIGVLLDRGSRARWLLTPGIVVLAASASTAGKLVARRPRPGASVRVVPFGQLGAAGFPSTHTACAFAIAGLHRGSRRRRWLHLVAIAIGFLRVRRRAHCCGDVVAGAILGYGIAWRAEGVWRRAIARAARPERRVALEAGR